MKKTVLIAVNILIFIYAFFPLPTIPHLPNSSKSTLPGDSYQISNVNAYFTDITRAEVMAFYRSIYQQPFFIRINHPPEKSKQIIIDTIQSTYLEELVIPFKQSLFINGYEWQNDVFTKPENRAGFKLYVGTQVFNAKITTRTFTANPFASLIAMLLTEFAILYAVRSIRSLIYKK